MKMCTCKQYAIISQNSDVVEVQVETDEKANSQGSGLRQTSKSEWAHCEDEFFTLEMDT